MSHFSSNMPSIIFYELYIFEIFSNSKCTLRITDFLLRASDLFSRMRAKDRKRAALTEKLKGLPTSPKCFFKDLVKFMRK